VLSEQEGCEVESITSSKVPVLRFVLRGISVELSGSKPKANVAPSLLADQVNECKPHIGPVYFALTALLERHNLGKSNTGISSYNLLLLLLHFIPVIAHSLRAVLCRISLPQSHKSSDASELLLGFVQFHSTRLNLHRGVYMSPKNGQVLLSDAKKKSGGGWGSVNAVKALLARASAALANGATFASLEL
jgi:hypothetical protein